jgi:hypothetical protein
VKIRPIRGIRVQKTIRGISVPWNADLADAADFARILGNTNDPNETNGHES